MQIRIFLLIAVTGVALAAPAGAQNKSAEAPVVIAPPPPPVRTEAPPAGTPVLPAPSQPAPEAPVTRLRHLRDRCHRAGTARRRERTDDTIPMPLISQGFGAQPSIA